jgi:hypothetical protein
VSRQSDTTSIGSVRLDGAWRHVERLRSEPACFALVAGVYLLYLFVSGYDSFYYDAAVYWQQGKSFDSSGHFSLFDYSDSGGYPRGYSFPLLNYVIRLVGSHLGAGSVTTVKVFGALLAATLGVVLLPRLARVLFPGARVGLGRVLLLNGLIFLYWRDHFDFPLSDFPALVAAIVGLLGLLRATTAGYLVAGLGLGLAANARPAYLLPLVLTFAIAAFVPVRGWDARQRGAAVGLVLAGVFLAFLPQALINQHQGRGWSPLVHGQRDISLLQLSDGMYAQKYETFVGAGSEYPTPKVYYFDPATQHVLQADHRSATITSYSDYAGIIVHHPAAMAAGYLRRLFNGLDVRYSTPYIKDLGDTSIVLSLIQYTLLFLAICTLLVPAARRRLGRVSWTGLAVLVSPCLAAIPGAVEPRFFLPLQMLAYMLVCFGTGKREWLFAGKPDRIVGLAAAYVAFVLVCLTLSSATLARLEHPGPTLGIGDVESSLWARDRRVVQPLTDGDSRRSRAATLPDGSAARRDARMVRTRDRGRVRRAKVA